MVMKNKSVSVAICSVGRGEELRRLVSSLQDMFAQELFSFFEIVVVEVIEKEEATLSPIKGVVYEAIHASQGFGCVRQSAIEIAQGDVVVFIDDDCIPCLNWLYYLLAPFDDDKVVAVGGGFVPQRGNIIAYATSLLGLPGGGFQRLCRLQGEKEETRDLSNGSLAMLRQSVLDVGGYNVDLRQGGEDSDLIARLQGATLFEPNALVAHRNRGDWRGIWAWFFRRGMAVAQYHASDVSRGWSLRRSGIFKLSIATFFLLFLPAMLTLVLCLLYYGFNIFRTYKGNSPAIRSSEIAEEVRLNALKSGALFVAPILRLWMDTAFDFGFWSKRKSLKGEL